ncbi:MAG: pantoate--beta-alanine ligase [Gammaproteobacteria bacterium]|nr:pantoate--beta-alanine ligase [Gammaproteobacteria bacterium]
MTFADDIEDLREQVSEWRSDGESIALVATMGNLHAGHLSLVAEAKKQAFRVVVSIFVNPLQFGADEDLAAYPRTLLADLERLEEARVDLVFMPTNEVIYPRGAESSTQVQVPERLTEQLCGVHRPGHFVGVATVVSKLFNLVQPQVALFGQKDYQQLLVIRRLCDDLNYPIEVVSVPTQRESDGLAMSSRNGYLSSDERARAPLLYQKLTRLAKTLLKCEMDRETALRQTVEALNEAGLRVEYLAVRSAADLSEVALSSDPLSWVLLVAVQLERTRLIDNLILAEVDMHQEH